MFKKVKWLLNDYLACRESLQHDELSRYLSPLAHDGLHFHRFLCKLLFIRGDTMMVPHNIIMDNPFILSCQTFPYAVVQQLLCQTTDLPVSLHPALVNRHLRRVLITALNRNLVAIGSAAGPDQNILPS